MYDLKTFGKDLFLKKKLGKDSMILKASVHDRGLRRKYFFVEKNSIQGVEMTTKWKKECTHTFSGDFDLIFVRLKCKSQRIGSASTR